MKTNGFVGLREFQEKIEVLPVAVFERCVGAVYGSVVDGSKITGSPGQPVLTGFLKGDWRITELGPLHAFVYTTSPYALKVEHAAQKLVSKVGGHHSVKKTRSGWQRLVTAVTQDLKQNFNVRLQARERLAAGTLRKEAAYQDTHINLKKAVAEYDAKYPRKRRRR